MTLTGEIKFSSIDSRHLPTGKRLDLSKIIPEFADKPPLNSLLYPDTERSVTESVNELFGIDNIEDLKTKLLCGLCFYVQSSIVASKHPLEFVKDDTSHRAMIFAKRYMREQFGNEIAQQTKESITYEETYGQYFMQLLEFIRIMSRPFGFEDDYGSFSNEDLVAAASPSIIEKMDTFELSAKTKFMTFASRRLLGAYVDTLRRYSKYNRYTGEIDGVCVFNTLQTFDVATLDKIDPTFEDDVLANINHISIKSHIIQLFECFLNQKSFNDHELSVRRTIFEERIMCFDDNMPSQVMVAKLLNLDSSRISQIEKEIKEFIRLNIDYKIFADLKTSPTYC